MLRKFSNTFKAVAEMLDSDDTPAAKSRIRASRKNIVSKTVKKMQLKLVEYEQNFDRFDKWFIELEVGINYTGRPLQYIKDQHLR